MAEFRAQQTDALNSTPTNATTRHIFDLPQELQDIIFKYAYTKGEEIKLVVDPSQQPKTYFPTPADLELGRATRSPKLKVNEWFVCKKWFVAAARAYAENQAIPVEIAEGRVGSLKGVLHAFGTSFSTTAPHRHFFLLQTYPRLRHLEVRFNRYDGWQTTSDIRILPATNDHIKTMRVFKRLLEIPGLQEIRVVRDATFPEGTPSAAEVQVFESNLRQFEDLVKSHYGQRSTDSETPASDVLRLGTSWRAWQDTRNQVALYAGSEVCEDSSQSVSAVVRSAAMSAIPSRSLVFAPVV